MVKLWKKCAFYIANLHGKYNEGELIGAWFEPPIDMDEVKSVSVLNGQYEEYNPRL